MSKHEIQVQVNVIEENESGEFVITLDKKPQEYRNIFFYKGVPADQSNLWKLLAGKTEPAEGEKVNPVIRFNILHDNKKVNFAGKVIVYFPKELLHNSSDKDKKAPLAKGEIIDGLKEGNWVYYHEKFDDMEQLRPNEFESNIVSYKKGILNGEFNSIQQNGMPFKNGTYKDGKKAGKWTSYNSYTGNVSCEETFEDGEEVGLRLSYHSNGQLRDEYYLDKNSKPEITQRSWFENGQIENEEHYKNGKKDGKWLKFYENGNKYWEKNYKNDTEHGPIIFWHKDTQEKKSEVNYVKGELSGDNISFWENGLKKQQGTFVNGKENGTFTYYSPDNKDSSELTYDNGKPMDGVSSEWWKNGQIWVVKTWKDGLCQGETLWWENGAMMREDLYEKGEKISVKAWNDDGTERKA
jgi:antitoxin component YwqK of YwqJK toxin-antitoxin module